MSTPSMIRMLAPDGTPGLVPQSGVADALKDGGRLGARIKAPDGTLGTVPLENVKGALSDGGQLVGEDVPPPQPNMHEVSSAPPGVAWAPYRVAANVAGLPGSIYHAFADAPTTPEEQAVEAAGVPTIPSSGRVALAAKRLLYDPQAQTYQRGQQVEQLANQQIAGSRREAALRDAAGAYKMASLVPLVGPLAAHLATSFQGDPTSETATEQQPYGTEADPYGALAEGTGYALLPKAQEELTGRIIKPGFQAVGQTLGQTGRAVGKTVGLGYTPEEMLTKAGGPSVQGQEGATLPAAIRRAAPRLVEQDQIRKIDSVQGMADGAYMASRRVWDDGYQPQIDRHPTATFNASAIGDQIRSGVDEGMRDLFPEQAEKAEDFADKFQGDLSLQKAGSYLRALNAKLKSYYKLTPEGRAAAGITDGMVSAYEDAADGLRNHIDDTLESLGEQDPRGLRQEYGALKQIQRVFEKRAVVTGRSHPLTLQQYIALAGGAGEAATAAMMGHPLGALAGAVPIGVTTAARYLNSPDVLVRRAMRGFAETAEPARPLGGAAPPSTGAPAPRPTPPVVPPWTNTGQGFLRFDGTATPAAAAQATPAAPGAPPVEMPGVSPEGVQAFSEGAKGPIAPPFANAGQPKQTPTPSETVAPEAAKAPPEVQKYSTTPERIAARDSAVKEAVQQLRNGNTDKATYSEIRNRAYTPELEPEYLHGISKSPDRLGEAGLDTREANQGSTGKYTPEREKMHHDRTDQVLGPDQGPEENPVVVFQGGGAASGKTESLGKANEAKHPGIRTIDSDVLKFGDDKKGIDGLPEAKYLQQSDPLGAAARLHEESSDLAKKIQREALRRRQSVIIDTVGSNPEKMLRQMQEFKDAGYRVEVHYVDKDFQSAAQSMANRFERPFIKTGTWGRWVPPEVAEPAHRGAARAFHIISDSDVPDETSLRMANAKGAEDVAKTTYTHVMQDSKILDDVRYAEHRKKGGYDDSGHGGELDRAGLQGTPRGSAGRTAPGEAAQGEPGTMGAGAPTAGKGAGGEAAPEVTNEPTLPGMEHVPAERAAASAEEQGRQLSQQMAEAPRSIEGAAGEMERGSPLFRGTEASPQSEMFGGEPVQRGVPPPGEVGRVNTSDLKVDPHRFQYKGGTDVEGVSPLLKETRKWNPDLAGMLQVWRDPADGQTYVVNGHHRFELAKRLGVPDVVVRHIEADSAKVARAKGAMQNIAEGRGTAVDAAKFFRDTGMSPDELQTQGLSMSEAKVHDGLALSTLDPEIFQRVINGDLRQGRAIAIGEAGLDHTQQKSLVDTLEKRERGGKNVTDGQLAEMIRFQKDAGKTTETQTDLFGSQQVERSLGFEKAEVSDYVKQQIAREKRTFGFVSKGERAQELSRGGNVIDVERSGGIAQQAAQAAEVYDKLSTRGGPISDILNRASHRLADGENAATVKGEAYSQIREEIRKTLAGGA